MNHHILQARDAARRHGVRLAQGRPGGPELDVILVLAGDGDPPANPRAPRKDGEAELVGVLVQKRNSRRIPANRLAMQMAMGRATSVNEDVKEWEIWGPRGPHRIARLGTVHADDPRRAVHDLMRHRGPRAALATTLPETETPASTTPP